MQFAMAAINLEGEKVFPLGATGMQPRGLAARVAQANKCIVVHGHIPEKGRGMSFHHRKFAQENSSEIDQMHSLINQLPAARQLRVRAPLAVVSDASALSVTG